MLIVQYLLRSRPELNSGTVPIFWFIIDEHMHFCAILRLCVRMVLMNFPLNVFISFSSFGSKILPKTPKTTR